MKISPYSKQGFFSGKDFIIQQALQKMSCCLFTWLITQLWPAVAVADWPLWSGGTASLPITRDKDGKPIEQDIDGKKQIIEYLKKVEVYRLDQVKTSEWRLTFAKPDKGVFTGFEVKVEWKDSNKDWQFCCWKKIELNKIVVLDCTNGIKPVAIPDKINRHTKAEPNWLRDKKDNPIPARKGDTITFTVTGAQQYTGAGNAKSPVIGKLVFLYGSPQYLYEFNIPKPGGYFGYHNGVDIAAPAGTSIGFLTPSTSIGSANISSVQYQGSEKGETRTQFFQEKTLLGKEYVYAHIRTSDAIEVNQTYPKYVKLGEIGKEHLLHHLHFSITHLNPPKTQTGIPCENPLETIIDRVDPNPKPVQILPWSPPTKPQDWIILKADEKSPLTASNPTTSTDQIQKNSAGAWVVRRKVDIIAGGGEPIEVTSGQMKMEYAGVREAWYKIFTISGSAGKTPQEILHRALLGPLVFQTTLPPGAFLTPLSLERQADVICSLAAPASEQGKTPYYILTNNTDPTGAGRSEYLSKDGCWDTTRKQDDKPVYPDGLYKVQVRFASDIVRRPKYSADEWSNWSDSEQEVIVDNTPPRVLDFRVSVVGGKAVMPIKRGDHLILYIPFDQPMSTGPTVQVGSTNSGPWTLVQLWGTWSINDLDNKQAPFQHLPFIRQALLSGRVVMPTLTAQTGNQLYFRLTGAKGLGLFTHTIEQKKTKLTLPDDTMVPAVQTDPALKCRNPLSNDPDNLPICVDGDLVPPKITLQQTKNKVTLTCSDKESGLAYCSLQPPTLSASLCAQEQDVSKLFPQSCASQTYQVQGWVKDCTGNRAKEGLTQETDPDLNTTITIPPLVCEPQDRSDACWKRTEQLSCNDGVDRCVVSSVDVQRRGAYSPGCDQPDENIDLSSHSLRYDQLTNVEQSARVGVLESAYAPQTIYLLGTFGEKAALVPRSFTPALVQTQPVLVLPSGSLLGQSNNSALKAALEGYVSQGGRLLVLAQAWGKEWSLLPGKLAGKGWNEDISCFWRATKIDQHHVGLAAMQEQQAFVPVDIFKVGRPQQRGGSWQETTTRRRWS